MIILKFFWWAFFIGSAIASIGSFTNEKANSLGRLKNYAGVSFLTIFVITYFIGFLLSLSSRKSCGGIFLLGVFL